MNEKEFQNVIEQLQKLQGSDDSGHGLDHVFRVLKMAEDFCDEIAEADSEEVRMIALLHDADDYKLTGRRDGSLENAERILETTSLAPESRKRILQGIATIGYSKRLSGIVPASLEASIVSDADMCDASGITGI
ncbi:MAG: HD domain-containing protein, partial [Erysipelotrichaceae bacterium]|nr:HD domain-containing protein [Erysipelotrichaceae bacterium]